MMSITVLLEEMLMSMLCIICAYNSLNFCFFFSDARRWKFCFSRHIIVVHDKLRTPMWHLASVNLSQCMSLTEKKLAEF